MQLGEVPARRIGMEPVMESGVVAHFLGQRAEQVADALLLLDVDVEVADHDDPALAADALLAAAEFAGGHVALHDVHAILLVEGDTGYFVEADHVVLADQTALAVGHVDEHLSHGRLAARDQVGVRRDLLIDVAFTCPSRTQLHQVEVALDKRNHAQQHHAFGLVVESRRL